MFSHLASIHPSIIMSNIQESDKAYPQSTYWYNGAYCENCGVLTGNVINNGVHPLWHPDCNPGCKTVWHKKTVLPTSNGENPSLINEEERKHLDYTPQHAYKEDDEELELEAIEEYKRELEAQEREEEEREKRAERESRYKYYYDDDDD